MIVLRRIIAAALALVFVAALFGFIVYFQGVGSATNPGFIASKLREADAYNFVYDQVLPAVLNDIAARGIEADAGFGDGRTTTITFDDPARAAAAAQVFIETVAPREYVQERGETFLDQVAGYGFGRRDEFSIDLHLAERVLALPDAVRAAAAEISPGRIISRDIMAPVIEDAAADLTFPTLGVAFTPNEVVEAATRVVPPEWIDEQIFAAADELAPYFAGQADSFAIRIDYAERIPVVVEVFIDEVRRKNLATKLLFERVVDPAVDQAVASLTLLSFDIPISREEITGAVRQVAPPEWIIEEAEGVMGAAARYISGQSDTLAYSVDLRDRKVTAVDLLSKLADRKIGEVLAAIPNCATTNQIQRAASNVLSFRLPRCTAAGLNLTGFRAAATSVFKKEIETRIGRYIPDTVSYTDTQFRSVLGPIASAALDDARKTIQEGFVYTNEDLIADWGRNGNPDDVRRTIDIIRRGEVYSQVEFERDYQNFLERQGVQNDLSGPSLFFFNVDWLTDLDRSRANFGRVLTYKFVAGLPLILLLIAIGFLGGRNWRSRLMWAAGTVVVAAAAAAVIFGPMYSAVGDTLTTDAQTELSNGLERSFRSDFPRTAGLIDSGIVVSKVKLVVNAIVSGMVSHSLGWLITGLVVLAVALIMEIYARPGVEPPEAWLTLTGTVKARLRRRLRDPADDYGAPPAGAGRLPVSAAMVAEIRHASRSAEDSGIARHPAGMDSEFHAHGIQKLTCG